MYQQNLTTYQSGHPTYERASTPNALSAPPAPSAPAAPSINEVDSVPSYQQAILTSVNCPLPSYDEATQSANDILLVEPFTKEQVISALEHYVANQLFYSRKPLKEITINKITMRSALHYKLETLTERRETKWKYEAYRGPKIDRDFTGPGPWEVNVFPREKFQKDKIKLEIPKSEYTKTCHRCNGWRMMTCSYCSGRGSRSCCSNNDCIWCRGSGRRSCSSCSGSGSKTCSLCRGSGRLRHYLQLTVKWNNNIGEYVNDQSEIPDKKIKKVAGNIAFQERKSRVNHIYEFPDLAIVQASKTIIHQHFKDVAFPQEIILEQRHNVKVVPVAFVSYTHKSKSGTFFVYGLEHKVYFRKYPSRFLGCCIS